MIRGHVADGAIVLDEPLALADGTEVRIEPIDPPRTNRPLTVSEDLARFAGTAHDLPADASQNIDHYLYGAPKR